MVNKLDLFGNDTASRGVTELQPVRIVMPSIWQWVKAGIGVTIGFGIVSFTFGVLYLLFIVLPLLAALVRR